MNFSEDRPPRIPRPKLAQWMFERDLKLKDAQGPLGVKLEQVRRYCLPFTDPMRAVPSPKVMARIIAWTGGEVRPDDFFQTGGDNQASAVTERDFYPPHIRGEDRPAVRSAEGTTGDPQ